MLEWVWVWGRFPLRPEQPLSTIARKDLYTRSYLLQKQPKAMWVEAGQLAQNLDLAPTIRYQRVGDLQTVPACILQF